MTYLRMADVENIDAVLFDRQNLTIFPGGATIAAGSRSFRVGDCIARNVSTKKLSVAKFTQVAAAAATTVAVVTVDDAHAFEIGDSVTPRTGGTDGASRTITGINYDTNVITVSANWSAALVENTSSIGTRGNEQHRAIGIALLPSRDKDAALLGGGVNDVVSRIGDSIYGSLALTGRFKYNKLRNFSTLNTHSFHADLGGLYNDDLNSGNGIYIVDEVPSTFSLT